MSLSASAPSEHIHIVDDNLRQGFAQVPRPVLRARGLSLKAKVVYTGLLDYAWQQGSCFPGQARMANDLDVSVDTIQRGLRELKRYQLIDWKQHGLNKPNTYYLLRLSDNPNLSPSLAVPPPEPASQEPNWQHQSAASGNRKLRLQETAALRHKEDPGEYTQLQAEEKRRTQKTLPISRDLSLLKFKGTQVQENTRTKILEHESRTTTATDPPKEARGFARIGSILGQRIPARATPTRSPAPAAVPPQPSREVAPTQARQLRASPAPGTAERQALRKTVQDCIAALDDWDSKLDSCVGRACNLYQRSGLAFEQFKQLFADAKWSTRERGQGMAYCFTVLEDYCGLREHSPTLRQGPPRSGSTRPAAPRSRKTIGGPLVRVVPLRQDELDENTDDLLLPPRKASTFRTQPSVADWEGTQP